MTRTQLKLALVALACQALLAPAVCNAFSITNVMVLPTGAISPSDSISIVVGIATPSQDAFLFAPTTLVQTDNLFTADIFIDDGRILPATDFLEETLTLGFLDAGEYDYLIRITTGYDVNFGVREVSGSFTVVPVPAALVLLASGLMSLRLIGRRPAVGSTRAKI